MPQFWLSDLVRIFDATSTPVAGSTKREAADEKMAKDARSKTGIFTLLGYIPKQTEEVDIMTSIYE